jgi:hypothetical protein
MTRTLLLGGALTLLVAHPGLAAADPVEALTFSSALAGGLTGPLSAGFAFGVSVPIEVTDLGAFDMDGDGLVNSHEVGIFDGNTIALVASATVTTDDPLIDGFHYVAIAPVTLDTSTFYIVAAADYGGAGEDALGLVDPTTLTVAPEITYYRGQFSQMNSGLHYPTLTLNPDYTTFGGSFRYTVAPEPSELELAGASLLGLLALARRERRPRQA